MANTKYDVGDILTFCVEDRCYATAVIVKWHITSTYIEGVTLERHTDYDAFIKADGSNFRFIHEAPECVFYNYKIAGHIDISGMPNDMVKNNLIYATAYELCEERIPYAILVHWNVIRMNEKNCCYDGHDKLKEENEQLKKDLGSANDKIFELNKEIDRMRDSYRNDRFRIATNLRKIGFTSEAIRNIIETDMV